MFLNELKKCPNSVIRFTKYYNTIPHRIGINEFFSLEFKYQYGIFEAFFESLNIMILAANKAYITMYIDETKESEIPYIAKNKDGELLIDQYDIYNDPRREEYTNIYKIKERAITNLFKLLEDNGRV